jgi:hypothetical protein
VSPAEARVDAEAEMARIRASAEAIWAERSRDAKEMSALAEERARVYAAEKLERLSAALDRIRESLSDDGRQRPPPPKDDSKRMV